MVTVAGVTQSDVKKVLYDAESGNLWLSDTGECYTAFAEIAGGADNFQEDVEMLNYIEGKWEHPPYDTVIEAIQYSLTGMDMTE